MKHILITAFAAVLLVGCGESQQESPSPETQPAEPVAKATQPEPTAAEAADISIHDAALSGNIEAVKQHIAAGTDVNAKGDDGRTPLHYAALRGHEEIVELLIANGADVNAEGGFFERTPLHDAANLGHKEIAELLIANGADVNAKGMAGFTPLHLAAKEHPLHLAAKEGLKETIELLIAKGADVNAKDDYGTTPLGLAKPYPEIANLLRKHGGKTNEELKTEGK